MIAAIVLRPVIVELGPNLEIVVEVLPVVGEVSQKIDDIEVRHVMLEKDQILEQEEIEKIKQESENLEKSIRVCKEHSQPGEGVGPLASKGEPTG